MAVLWFILALMLLIAAHEMGHMVLARIFGVRVTDFSVFLGPALKKKRVGGTVFSLRVIPLGGYIRVVGMGANKQHWLPIHEEIDTGDADKFWEDAERLAASRGVDRSKAHDVVVAAKGFFGHEDVSVVTAWERGVTAVLGPPEKKNSASWTVLYGDAGRSFYDVPAFARFLIAFAGPVVNLMVAIVLLASTTMFLYQTVWDGELRNVANGSPAAQAGLENGDRILSIEGSEILDLVPSEKFPFSSDDASVIADLFAENDEVYVQYERQGTITDTTIRMPDGDAPGFEFVASLNVLSRSELSDSGASGNDLPSEIQLMAESTGRLSGDANLSGENALVTIVGASSIASWMSDFAGFQGLVFVTAMISLSLGLINLLPVPPLDGWLMMKAAIEGAVDGKRKLFGQQTGWEMPQKTASVLAGTGGALILLLMIAVFVADVLSLTNGS